MTTNPEVRSGGRLARRLTASNVRPGSMKCYPIPRQLFYEQSRKLGLITYHGHIEVHSSLLSAILHEKPQLKSIGQFPPGDFKAKAG